ncbi:NUDIX hydrolase [Aestuariivirga sp. YIM B02566]|jgi:8-oxo-dGTP diphosphatase|uniref:NUDIX domain-containing protein n=1 Tax=Taklimakanibacter albus TaxID=2800327 RepID=A0ACC5R186_9HYPH|nr:NUDIX domain-containing protein [Aestuariivirga sp. YIM B02566]MBK1866424.1 NUDIX domain-containing protein [Aestuariivirga sp. YIM B02566]
MRARPSSRLLIVNALGQVLLFLFEPKRGGLVGEPYWATPGGALDEGESYAEAACRELREETGLLVNDPGPEVAQRTAIFPLINGEFVRADERFFLIRVEDLSVSNDQWTEVEHRVMTAHRWFSAAELATASDPIFPENLADMLRDAGAWERKA